MTSLEAFEHGDPVTPSRDRSGGGRAGEPGSEDDDVGAHSSESRTPPQPLSASRSPEARSVTVVIAVSSAAELPMRVTDRFARVTAV